MITLITAMMIFLAVIIFIWTIIGVETWIATSCEKRKASELNTVKFLTLSILCGPLAWLCYIIFLKVVMVEKLKARADKWIK